LLVLVGPTAIGTFLYSLAITRQSNPGHAVAIALLRRSFNDESVLLGSSAIGNCRFWKRWEVVSRFRSIYSTDEYPWL